MGHIKSIEAERVFGLLPLALLVTQRHSDTPVLNSCFESIVIMGPISGEPRIGTRRGTRYSTNYLP